MAVTYWFHAASAAWFQGSADARARTGTSLNRSRRLATPLEPTVEGNRVDDHRHDRPYRQPPTAMESIDTVKPIGALSVAKPHEVGQPQQKQP
jgi:hypothetical protein